MPLWLAPVQAVVMNITDPANWCSADIDVGAQRVDQVAGLAMRLRSGVVAPRMVADTSGSERLCVIAAG
jgi:threonyl-tRNA synthetase